jgi:hypothetical protein
MTFIEDPGADARSLMLTAPCICSGEKTGHPCRHYWGVNQKFKAANADTVRDGEKQRACTLMPGWPLEFTSEESPTKCNRYEPRPKPGLLALVKRAVGLASGYEAVYRDFEDYRPMTWDEIQKLREDKPDPVPDPFRAGKDPSQMTVDDIVNGPQIGILKPGESLPGESQETKDFVDGLFNRQVERSDGILTKKD